MGKDRMGLEDIIRTLGIDDTAENVSENNVSNNTYKKLVSYVTTLPPKQFILLSSLIGILLIDGIDAEDQIILGKFINNVGQTILTAAAQEKINDKINSTK